MSGVDELAPDPLAGLDEPPPRPRPVRSDRWAGAPLRGRRAWLRGELGDWVGDVRVLRGPYWEPLDATLRVAVVPELEWQLAAYERREPGDAEAVGSRYEPWPAELVWVEP